MFHLFKKVYLQFDYKFETTGYNFILASTAPTQGLPMGYPESKREIYKTTASFNELLQNNFDGNIESFWKELYAQEEKTIVYLNKDDFFRLQIQFLKSVLVNATVEDLYLIHKTFIESVRIRSYIATTSYDFRNEFTRKVLQIPTFEQFSATYDLTLVSNYLKNNIDKKTLSFEFLLGDYFYRGDESPYKAEMLNRVKIITWDNWADELEQLRLESIFGFLDMDKLEDGIQIDVGEIESKIKSSEKLAWLFDENFLGDAEYIRENYNHKHFDEQFEKIYSIWNAHEDMSEMNDMIMNEKYEELLNKDIARGFGCTYTFEKFRDKSNQVLATYLYRKKRAGQTSDLKAFKLS